MISSLAGASIPASHADLAQLLPVDAQRRLTSNSVVPKQDVFSVPKLHNGSLQTFGDALESMLSQSEDSDLGSASALRSKASFSSAVPGAETSTAFRSLIQVESEDVVNATDPAAADTAAAEVSVKTQELSQAADQAAHSEKALARFNKASNVNDSSTVPLSIGRHTNSEPAYSGLTAWESNPGLAGLAVDLGRQTDTSDVASENQSDSMSALNVGSSQKGTGVRNANTLTNAVGQRGDVEAFRMDLHSSAESLEEDSSVKDPLTTEAPDAQPAASLNNSGLSTQISDPILPAETGVGIVIPDKASRGDTLSNSTQAESRVSSPSEHLQAQKGQADHKQVSANGTEDEKPDQKAIAGNAPDVESPKEGDVMSSAAFHSGAGLAGGKSLNTGEVKAAAADRDTTPVASPAREVVLRVQGNSGEVVSVRLLDQGGQVQLAVRSNDPSTASQLRQDLSALTNSLDRIGWKADPAASTSLQPVNQPPARSEAESQNGREGASLDWDEQPAKKQNSTAELWDKVLANQGN
ncbi:MAG: hypothetical protein JO340_13875 [Acidobacteriaceae bacterium]|nr:hypothetical protein [Acidobacteriaceae bacterium]